jgi:hypothetical protein
MSARIRAVARVRSVATDLAAHVRDESHQSDPLSYATARTLYVRSKGRSRHAVRRFFSIVRRDRPQFDPLGATDELRQDGLAIRRGFLSPESTARLREVLTTASGDGVASGTRVRLRNVREADGLPRFDYDAQTLLTVPGVLDLVANSDLLGCAAEYLQAQPIFTGVNAWWSLPSADADAADLSAAAQLFHFDYDWPAFVKFFIYLTDVDEGTGPFAFVKGSHEFKPFWRDARIATEELYAHGLREERVTGAAGTLAIADTSGFHRGTPPRDGPRLVLQLEYAVSRFGASAQYPLLPAWLRPESRYRHTYDVFARPA